MWTNPRHRRSCSTCGRLCARTEKKICRTVSFFSHPRRQQVSNLDHTACLLSALMHSRLQPPKSLLHHKTTPSHAVHIYPPSHPSPIPSNVALAITLHSMCHPGRPSPQGLGQLGSPSRLRFQSAKSPDDLRYVYERSVERRRLVFTMVQLFISHESASLQRVRVFLANANIVRPLGRKNPKEKDEHYVVCVLVYDFQKNVENDILKNRIRCFGKKRKK